MPPIRHVWVLAHRWIGLVIAGFLIVAGATGALLAWHHELSAALAPELYHIAPPRIGAKPIDAAMLRDRAAATVRDGTITFLPLNSRPGEALFLYANGSAKPDLAVDPYTGRVLAHWDSASLSAGRLTVMPFLYKLHYSLALGTVGTWAFGIVALLWTLDTFVGAYLTFPARHARGVPARSPHGWLARWRRAWSVRRGRNVYKLNMDLHRAGGLWLWAMLFVFAWSSVGFNLSQVHTPVMRAIFAFRDVAELPALPAPKPTPGLKWPAALDRGRTLMAGELEARGLTSRFESYLAHDASTGTFRYAVSSSADRADKPFGATTIIFDADTGARRDFYSPLDDRTGDTVTRWLYDLHLAAIWGRPYDVFVTLLGLAVVMLSGTGVLIWAKKRAARVAAKRKRRRVSTGWRPQPGNEPVAAE